MAGDQDVLVFEVAVNVTLRMRERERIECLRDDRNAVFVTETATLMLRRAWTALSLRQILDQVNHAVVHAAIDNSTMFLCLSAAATSISRRKRRIGFVADCKLRQEGLDRDGRSGGFSFVPRRRNPCHRDPVV